MQDICRRPSCLTFRPKVTLMPIGLHLPPQQHVYAGFALHALTMGSIFPRMPDIMAAMGVGEGALGLGLMGAPVGTFLALTFAAPILERIGFRRALLMVSPLVALFYAVAVQATGPLGLFLLLIPVGVGIGSAEILLNLEADRTEALIGRRIMNRAHSFWSFGFFGAGLFGAWMAHLGISPQLHLGLMVLIAVAAVALLLGRFEPAPLREATGQDTPRFALPTPGIMLLVAVTLSALLLEGAGIDWSAIYMRTVHDSGPFVAGIAVAAMALPQAITRFVADKFVERFGPELVSRALALCMAAAVVLLLMPISPALSLLGFALIGIGTSVFFPLAMSAAAQRTDRPASINVAALAQISFTVFMVGPPLLGYVAEHYGIRWTYGFALPLVLLTLLTAGALQPGKRGLQVRQS